MNVDPQYLLSHGFKQYDLEESRTRNLPYYGKQCLHFIETTFHRQMFAVTFCHHDSDPNQGYGATVHVQEDAGFGFIEIPFPWWDLPIEYFEAVYYGIRGNKPKKEELK